MGYISLIISLLVLFLIIYLITNLHKASNRNEIYENRLSEMQQQMTDIRNSFAEREAKLLDSFTQHFMQMNTNISNSIANFNATLLDTGKNMNERLDNASRIFGRVQKSMGSVEESVVQIREISKNISQLEDILKVPKLRGELGEFILNDLLSQILPNQYFQMQYTFSDNSKVDAVIFLKKKIVPIDAKFPLENFRKSFETSDNNEKRKYIYQFYRDVKKHIDTIANKYIRPDENTFNFAFMYIPAENVYYETIIHSQHSEKADDVYSYAMQKRVIPVSPNSFYAYLQSISLGLKGLQIEKHAERIKQDLFRLHDEFRIYKESFEILGSHIGKAKNKYEEASRNLEKIKNRFEMITEKTPEIQ